MSMVRKQVYIEPDQERLLKRRARELGVTEAELIRRAIDTLARSPEPEPFDADAWRSVVSAMDERAALAATGHGWKFRRDKLYEDRLGRLPR